ncbi:glycosyltransferase family 2 protein [Priestia megaterium]
MKISVVIPAFNSEAFIQDAINSVINQKKGKFTVHEIIVVDDGSTDNTGNVVEHLSNELIDTCTIRYHYQENQGVSAARNAGLLLAEGDFIALLDSDDMWLPYKLLKQIELFSQDSEVGLVCGQFINRVYEQNTYSDYVGIRNLYKGNVFKELLKGNFIGTTSVIMRKEVIEEVGLFDRELPLAEDYDLWLRISKKYKISYIGEPVFVKRFNGVSNISGGRSQKMHNFTRKVVTFHLEDSNLDFDFKKEVLNSLNESLIVDLIHQKQRPRALSHIWKELKKRKYLDLKLITYFCLCVTPISLKNIKALDNTIRKLSYKK